MSLQTCVIRPVRGIDQFIPVEDAVIQPGELIYLGNFSQTKLSDGPSNSHERTVCLPQQNPVSLPLSCCHLGMLAPSRDWRSISNPIRYSNNERIFVTQRQYVELCSAT